MSGKKRRNAKIDNADIKKALTEAVKQEPSSPTLFQLPKMQPKTANLTGNIQFGPKSF